MNIIITIILPIGLQLQLLTTIATRIVQEKFSWKKKKKEKTIITTIIFIIVFPQYYSSYVCKTTFVSRQTNKQYPNMPPNNTVVTKTSPLPKPRKRNLLLLLLLLLLLILTHRTLYKKAKRTHRCLFVEAPRLGPFEIDASSFSHFDFREKKKKPKDEKAYIIELLPSNSNYKS